ncbi:adenylate kinase [Coriobacteriia bacterium Es71-Z0120]|uniref:adenylate kinase n=1 Tax=Parvivirga hydrogeniphila TaxID=2939460 RepID=UPI002260A047|nr:adenylate kinase [Parvivirga hydrogeniphila]
MNLMLLGAPGAGKGTQAAKLVETYHLAHISTGDILRAAVAAGTPLGMTAKSYMDKGELVPDLVVIGLVKARLQEPDTAAGFILDGFPRTVAQADALDKELEALGKQLDAVISVEVDRSALIDRLTARRTCKACGAIYNVLAQPETASGVCPACGGELFQRDDDTVETVTNRLAVYERSTAPLIDYYSKKGLLRRVDGNRSVEDVFAQIREIVESAAR